MDNADTFGIGLVVMVVFAIILGRPIDPAWLWGFLAFLIAWGAGTHWSGASAAGADTGAIHSARDTGPWGDAP